MAEFPPRIKCQQINTYYPRRVGQYAPNLAVSPTEYGGNGQELAIRKISPNSHWLSNGFYLRGGWMMWGRESQCQRVEKLAPKAEELQDIRWQLGETSTLKIPKDISMTDFYDR